MTHTDPIKALVDLGPELAKLHPGPFHEPPRIAMQDVKTILAAVKSMRDRGKARDIQDFVLIDELQPPLTGPVTIFRHGE